MVSLGIELKGSTCIGIATSIDSNGTISIVEELKIELTDSYCDESVKTFFDQFSQAISSINPDSVVIKKRNEKGKFAGGAVSFKMEGLIQISATCKTIFISGAQSNSFAKKMENEPTVKKYQQQALICSLFGLETN